MQHGDAPGHASPEAVDGLRREGDLGHQHEGHAARVADALGGGQVDLGLAAAGDAAQQEQARVGRGAGGAASVVEGGGDGGVGAGLVGGEDGDGGAGRRGGRGAGGGAAAQQAALDQGVDVGGGGAGFGAGLAIGAGAVEQRADQGRAAPLGGAAPQRQDGRVGGGRVVAEARGEADVVVRPRRGRRARRRPASD